MEYDLGIRILQSNDLRILKYDKMKIWSIEVDKKKENNGEARWNKKELVIVVT